MSQEVNLQEENSTWNCLGAASGCLGALEAVLLRVAAGQGLWETEKGSLRLQGLLVNLSLHHTHKGWSPLPGIPRLSLPLWDLESPLYYLPQSGKNTLFLKSQEKFNVDENQMVSGATGVQDSTVEDS